MANREESDAAHDTFPGPGPLRSDEGRTNIRPVEQMVDAAIDRIEREYAASTGVTPGEALAVATQQDGQGLARRSGNGRLRWKGLDVSEDFRRYAERVARGEDLPPFAGKILAEPDAVFPWQPGQRAATVRRQPLRQQLSMWGGAALLLGGVAWLIFGALHSLDNDPLHRGESPLGSAVFSNRPSTDTAEASKAASPLEQIAAATDTLAPTEPKVEPALIDTTEAAPLALADKPSSLKDGKASAVSAPSAAKPQAAAPNSGTSHAVITLSNPNGAPALHGLAPSSAAPSSAVASAAASALTIPHLAVPSGAGGPALAPAAGGNINANVVASNSAPGASQSDPKKEPGREASAMGALLVETPSF